MYLKIQMCYSMSFCYDTDVFEFSQKPPVKWREVEKILIENGAAKVIHIKAKNLLKIGFNRP